MADTEHILRNMLEKIAHEQNFTNPEIKIKKVSTEGANFTSFLFEAIISAKDKDDLNLFAKVAAIGETFRAQALMKVFEIEDYFYEELLAKYKKLEEEQNVKEKNRLITPKFYGSRPKLYEETIVLEDLKCKGFTTLNRFELITWEYASTAITELVKLHALSFAYAEKDPEGFAKDLDKLKLEWTMNLDQMQNFFSGLIEKAVASVCEENRHKFAQYVSQFSNPELLLKYYRPNKKTMLRHGDFRTSNMMHKYNEVRFFNWNNFFVVCLAGDVFSTPFW